MFANKTILVLMEVPVQRLEMVQHTIVLVPRDIPEKIVKYVNIEYLSYKLQIF